MKEEFLFTVKNGAEVMANITQMNELTKKLKSIARKTSMYSLCDSLQLKPVFEGNRVFVELEGFEKAEEFIKEVNSKIDDIATISEKIFKLQCEFAVSINRK